MNDWRTPSLFGGTRLPFTIVTSFRLPDGRYSPDTGAISPVRTTTFFVMVAPMVRELFPLRPELRCLSVHYEPPQNAALRICVLMVVLWRQNVALGDADLMTAALATVDTGVGRTSSGFVKDVKGTVIGLRHTLAVLV